MAIRISFWFMSTFEELEEIRVGEFKLVFYDIVKEIIKEKHAERLCCARENLLVAYRYFFFTQSSISFQKLFTPTPCPHKINKN